MTLLRTSASLLLLTAIGLACRDATSTPARPSFAVANDTTPGGCTSNACQFNAFGDAASANWSRSSGVAATDTGGGGGGGGFVFGSVSVSRGGSPTAQETFLFYSIVECGAFGCFTLAGGFGTIPNGDFSASGPSYRLSTNTTGNGAFFTFAGATGQITVEWVADGLYESRFTGTSQVTAPGVRQQSSGQTSYKSAGTTGSVVGFGIPAGTIGQISNDHQVRITINR